LSAASRPWRRRDAAIAVAASAVAYALYARATWPWIALGWVGLVPWLAALDRARTFRRALLLGIAMAVAFELAVFGWFAFAIADYSGAPASSSCSCWHSPPRCCPQFPIVALARRRSSGRDRMCSRSCLSAAATSRPSR
jgi:apolipoprotein N-acyltransferase